MSLHPLKRSDINKEWNQGRKRKKVLIQPEYQLIITEGTDTEPNYFSAIADIVNSKYPNKINVTVEGIGDNTLNLLEKARRMVLASPNVIKHVWVVYDTDDFPPEHINKTAEYCEQYTDVETEYHAIWSNQCIELWFLLHFGLYHSDIHRKEYWPKLSEWLIKYGYGKYSKNRSDMFEILRPYMKTAIINATRLEEYNIGKVPSASAPGTRVHVLIKHLQEYL
ncbi:MAG: RloB domain-containing protein [Lachnospiraceae bacterium]|nr:RloB domain-containing protein [Lachnospiraceae bacterium]